MVGTCVFVEGVGGVAGVVAWVAAGMGGLAIGLIVFSWLKAGDVVARIAIEAAIGLKSLLMIV